MQEEMVKNLITIFFLVLAVFSFYRGYAKGMIKMVISFASVIIAVILTRIFTPMVADAIKNTTNIESTLTSNIYKMMIKTNLYDKVNIPWLKGSLDTGNIEGYIKNTLCTSIANAIINLICGIVVFIIILIIVKLIINILDVVNLIPVVGKLNKILGGVLGVLELVLLLWLVFSILRALSTIPEVKVINESISSSFIVGALYNNNLIYNLFLNLLVSGAAASGG